MNIRVDLNIPIKDGAEVIFRSPVDCSQVTGLKVYYPEEGQTVSREFMLADAHGNNVGDIDHLFAENAVVKVILDCATGMAFVQNADTNAYLEGRFSAIEDEIRNAGTPGGVAPGGVDGIVEQQHNNTGVCYRKWASGFAELWVYKKLSYTEGGNIYNIELPFKLVAGQHNGRAMVLGSAMGSDHSTIPVYTDIMDGGTTSILTMLTIGGLVPMDGTFDITAYITGFWK